jgi:hypothetical protein
MPFNELNYLAKTWSWLKYGFESRWGHHFTTRACTARVFFVLMAGAEIVPLG